MGSRYHQCVARLVLLLLVVSACERAEESRPGAGTVTVPPALPGEPPIGADREAMLQKFAANISQGLYTHSNLLFLLCNTEAGRAVANQSGDPMSMALLRRMVALFRQAKGMATITCPSPPPQSP